MRNTVFNPQTSKRRVWFLEFYPDSIIYNTNDFLNTIEHFPEYAYILHDKDVNVDTGELKKPHYHAVIRTTPCLISSILNKFPRFPPLIFPNNYLGRLNGSILLQVSFLDFYFLSVESSR